MTELLCIQTHSRKFVIAGMNYQQLNNRITSCCRIHQVDVGLDINIARPTNNAYIDATMGTMFYCSSCGGIAIKTDNILWINADLFAQIGTEDECEQYREKVVIEK